MAYGLGKRQEAELGRHSREGTAIAGKRLVGFLGDSRWLAKANQYGANAAERMDADRKAKAPPDGRALAEYVAASAPTHAMDGWSYLSRALNAALNGDPDTARHLAYYAELRAAMALLAAQGIGIFNETDAVVTASGMARAFGGQSTHIMTWLALEWWVGTPEAADVVGEIVQQAFEPISEWVAAMPSGGSWAAVGSAWLGAWGYDLKAGLRDRAARNLSSYNPSRLYNQRPLGSRETKEFITDWWHAFEPTAGLPFENIDKHLLRASLEASFKATRGVSPADNPARYRSDIASAKEELTGSDSLTDPLGSFLVRDSDPATWAGLLEAAKTDDARSARHHLQVISRASLLLRLATGAAAELLRRSGLTDADIHFWIDGIGEDRAFWAPGSRPASLTDVWADIEDALPSVLAADDTSFRALHDSCRDGLAVLTTADRVAVWGALAA